MVAVTAAGRSGKAPRAEPDEDTEQQIEDALTRKITADLRGMVNDRLFLDAPTTVRYGTAENLYGYAAIAAFRAARSPAGLARRLAGTVVTTYGRDAGTASTLFHREGMQGKVGRQTQTWVRTRDGWRVAAAHVSVIDDPDRRRAEETKR